jgi:alkaline phosphatase D
VANWCQKSRGVLAVLACGVLLSACGRKAEGPPAIDRIAFGSANRQANSQKFWQKIALNKPDLWIWTGDAVYTPPGDVNGLVRAFQTQAANSDYQAFARRTRILGTWNVHDYGAQPAMKDNPILSHAKKAFMDFLGEPQLSRRRTMPGIYAAQEFGPPGRRIKVILLDTRTFNCGPGNAERHGLLGSAQWAWLETELSRSESQFVFIVSSIPVIPTEVPVEKWNDYGAERARLLQLIGNTRAFGIVFLTGGRQLGEMSATTSRTIQYEILDVSSAGLSYFNHEYSGEKNRYRAGEVFIGHHFGLVTIDWSKNPPRLRLEIRDENNRVAVEIEQRRSEMEPRNGRRKLRKPVATELGAD